MKRTKTIRSALYGESPVLWGDIKREAALRAMKGGAPSQFLRVREAVLGSADDDALCWWQQEISGKAGVFLCPYPRRVADVRATVERRKLTDKDLRYGTGRGDDAPAGFGIVMAENDRGELVDQANAIDALGDVVTVALLSGDARPASFGRAGVRAGQLERGKSIHVGLAHKWSDDAELHKEASARLCVLLRGDPSVATDHARNFRSPARVGWHKGKARVQTALRAVDADDLPTLAELVELLAELADEQGLDPDAWRDDFETLKHAERAERAAAKMPAGELRERVAEAAARALSTLEPMPDDVLELLAGRDRARGVHRKGAKGGKHKVMARDTLVTAAKSGRALTLEQWENDPELQARGELRAWVPTDAGHTRSTGEERKKASGVLLLDFETGKLCLHDHAEGLTHWPSRPADPMLRAPALPAEGESRHLTPMNLAGERCVVNPSDTGSGKTYLSATKTQQDQERGRAVLTLNNSRALARQTVRDLREFKVRKPESHLDSEGAITLWPGDARVSCVNSLARHEVAAGTPLTIIIDESEAVIRALTDIGGTMSAQQQRETLEYLQELCARPDTELLLNDGTMGPATEELRELLMPGVEPMIIDRARARDFPVKQLRGSVKAMRAELYALFAESVRAGEKPILMSLSASDAEAFHAEAAQIDATGKLYTGDSSDAEKAELEKADDAWRDAGYVVCSPVAQYGLNFTLRGRPVFLWAPSNNVLPLGWCDAEQAVSRVRYPARLVAALQQPSVQTVKPLQAHKDELRAAREALAAEVLAERGETLDLEQGAALAELRAVKAWSDETRKAAPADDFAEFYRLRGANVEVVQLEADNGPDTLGERKEIQRAERAERIATCEPMTEGELGEARAFGLRGGREQRERFEAAVNLDTFGELDADIADENRAGGLERRTRGYAALALHDVGEGNRCADTERRAARDKTLGAGGKPAETTSGRAVMLRFLRVMLGAVNVRALFAPLSGAMPDEQAAAMLEQLRWSAKGGLRPVDEIDVREGARLWRRQWGQLSRAEQTRARQLNLAPGDVSKEPCAAVGNVLRRVGIGTRRVGKRKATRMDIAKWRRTARLAQRQHARWMVQEIEAFAAVLQRFQRATGDTLFAQRTTPTRKRVSPAAQLARLPGESVLAFATRAAAVELDAQFRSEGRRNWVAGAA